MKTAVTILIIIFLLIAALFSFAIIGATRNSGTSDIENSSTINTEPNLDIKEELYLSKNEALNDKSSSKTAASGSIPGESSTEYSESENNSSNNLYDETTQNAQIEDNKNTNTQIAENTESAEGKEEGGKEEEEESKEKIKDGTIRFFLDGDMENGIYLGETISKLESAESLQKYGEDFKNTGFKFVIKNNSELNLSPGSTHYVYIYFYTEKSGWDYIREEINLSGVENREKKITISIDKPEENSIITSIDSIEGWAVDLRSKENPGIKNIEIYLDGPRGYGKSAGKASYGEPEEIVALYLESYNYLNSGYRLEKPIKLEPGSTHTIFVYAFSSIDNSFNYKKIDIYLSGIKEEKAIINAQVNTQKFRQDNIIEINGFAIDKKTLEEKLKAEKERIEGSGEYTIRKIIFNSNRDGNENIYSINIDGTGLTKLTSNPGSDIYPEVSPDGSKIAYTSDIGGVWQIMIMDWDGGNKKQITHNNFRSAFPSWSYDSKYIYFEAYIDGDWELYRIKSDGTGQQRLTFNPGSHDWHPNGHPHSYRIIYESGTTGHENIYVINHDGSGKRKIGRDDSRRRVPDVSSTGTLITYMRYTGKNCDIWIMDYNGQNETRLTDNPGEDGHPAFSPDDKYIVYEEQKGSRENIIIIELATGKKTNITNSPYIDKDGSFLYR